MDLLGKLARPRAADMQSERLRRAERELLHLNTKISKLLDTLEEGDTEQVASSRDEECVICVYAAASMQTWPCGHRVVCRRCFVKTIQAAVSQRLLPLRCVVCRSKILRLRHGRPRPAPPPARLVSSRSWQGSAAPAARRLPTSSSAYSMAAPAPAAPAAAPSLFSVASAESSVSGVSSLSDGSEWRGRRPSAPPAARPAPRPAPAHASSLRGASAAHKKGERSPSASSATTLSGRLPPIREFQREFREGRRETGAGGGAAPPTSARPPAAAPPASSGPRRSCGATRVAGAAADRSAEERQRREDKEASERRRREEKAAAERRRREEKAAAERRRREEKAAAERRRKEEKMAAELRRKEEKARQRAEKEARRAAQEQERQTRQLAKQRAKQAAKQAKQEARVESARPAT